VTETQQDIKLKVESLKGKQRLFVLAYVTCFNATKAALEAKYSAKTAGQQGSRLLKNVEIVEAIDDFLAAHAMSAAEVLRHLTVIGRGNIGEVLNDAGEINLREARENGAIELVKKVKKRTTTSEHSTVKETEIEMHDRLRALELLAKYHDLTNKVRVEDWRSQAIADIRDGKIKFELLAEEFDYDLATELFAAAGIPVQVAESAGPVVDS
jgi:phage terminase small subunit